MSICRPAFRGLGLFLTVFVFAGLREGGAQTAWTNTLGGNWSAAGNWNPGVVPGSGTNAFITNTVASAYTVTNDLANATFGDLVAYNSGAGAVTLLNAASGFNPTGNVVIGRIATFNLNGFDATFGGSLVVSNTGMLRIQGATLTVGGNMNALSGGFNTNTLDNGGALIANTITNGATFQTLVGTGLIGGFLVNDRIVLARGPTAVLSITNGFENRFSLRIESNATVNIGGVDAASANASGMTATNFAGATITLGRVGALQGGHINASTTGIGIFNQGTIENAQAGSVSSFVNAVVVNDVGGLIKSAVSVTDRMIFHAIPTNRGTIQLGVNNLFQINNGDLVNEGMILSILSPGGQSFTVANGSIINSAGALIQGDASSWNARSILNQGTIIVSNRSGSGIAFALNAAVTNTGTIIVYRPVSATFNDRTMAGSNIVNAGTITAIGTGALLISNVPVNAMTINTTNLSTGTIISSNASLTVFDTTSHGGKLRNLGTLRVESNSVLAVGGFLNASEGRGKITVGLRGFLNEGTIVLNDGLFAVAALTNAATASLEGRGEVGRAQFTNMISGSLATTNFVRQFSAVNIINSGTIAPAGTLNLGIVTNLAGAQIVGFGTIQSVNVTNFYDGETLIVSNYNTGARIQNNAGATILASGGTLVLSNGLAGNLNAGTIGATNGGILQLGDGSLALTNNGTISVHNGGLNLGPLHNNDTIQVVDSGVTFSNTVVNAGRYISDSSTNIFLEDVTVTEPGTLEGWIGDLFDFKSSLLITSTNESQFYLSYSTVQFSGGGVHTNAVTGLEMGGTNEAPFFTENFAYGTLRLGSASDQVYFTNFVGAASNTALYAHGVDLLGDTNNVANLFSPFNIYYAHSGLNPNNAYLGDLAYELEGGGWLLPAIPEPSALLLVMAGAMFLRRRR